MADRITWDGMTDSSKLADQGVFKARFYADFGPDHMYQAETAPLVLAIDGPEVVLTIEDGAFSPDGDGLDDLYQVGILVTEPENVESWEIMVRDQPENQYSQDLIIQ